MRFADRFGLSASRGRGQRARSNVPARVLVILGAAVLACLQPTVASAQFGPTTHSTVAPPDDGLGPRDAMIQADTLIDDRDNNTVTAEGRV